MFERKGMARFMRGKMPKILNKRGEEIVEASIVLPLVILVILSMILLLIYFYACLQTQIGVHKELLTRQETFTGVYKITKTSETTERTMRGITSIGMRHESRGRLYLLRPADAILVGEEVSAYVQK